jgi:hypothetical protein
VSTDDPIALLGAVPETWLQRVAAGYQQVQDALEADSSGMATGQLRGELASALADGIDGDYPAGWALALPPAVHAIIGDAAAWQAHCARRERAPADRGPQLS